MRNRGGLPSHARLFCAFLLIFFCSMPTASYAKGSGSNEGCNAGTARHISIAEAYRLREKLEQACVQVTGISDGGTLYADLGGIYRASKAWEDHDPALHKAARIGLRPFPEADEDDDNLPKDGTWAWSAMAPRQVTLIGRLHNCSLDWTSGDPNGEDFEIRMGTGWCHYNSGEVLRPVAIVAETPITLTRMTGRRAWRQFGDIVPLKQDSAFAREALTFVDLLFAAARRGDRQALVNYHTRMNIELTSDGNVPEDEADTGIGREAQIALDLWFGSSGTVISQMARNAQPVTVRIFATRWKDTSPGAWACWGPAPMAEEQWPISSIDTGNVAGRP